MVKSLEMQNEALPPVSLAAVPPVMETHGRESEGRGTAEAADFGEGILNRADTLTRYRRLRMVNVDHGNEILRRLPRKAVLHWGKRIGLVRRKTFVASFEEMSLAFDLAVHASRRGKMPPVERYRAIARFPADSDEAIMLDAMCRSRFSFFAVKRRHAAAGLILENLFQQREIWFMDEGFEMSAAEGITFASRVVKPGLFHMSTGAIVPVDREIMHEVVAGLPGGGSAALLEEGGDAPSAEALYGVAVAWGLMETVVLL